MDGQPYFFDANVFEDDIDGGRTQPEPPPEPEFTSIEMEEAKRVAFEEGKKAGFEESEGGLSKQILTVLEKLDRNTSVLFAAEDDRNRHYENDAVQLCLNVMRKIFPVYTKDNGAAEIKSAIEDALTSHSTPERIVIELQNDVLEKTESYIKELECSLHKKITLRANPSFGIDQCHIHWPDGGIICNRQSIAEKTVSLIKETLAERGINSHDEEGDLASPSPSAVKDSIQDKNKEIKAGEPS